MHAIDINHKITFLAGRPGTGKTRTAKVTSKLKLQEGWKVIYFHAEGKLDETPLDYGAETPEHIVQFRLLVDLNSSLTDIYEAVKMPVEGLQHKGTLVIIDWLDLFDCENEDLFDFIRAIPQEDNVYFLLLSQVRRGLEGAPVDQVKKFVEQKYPTDIEHVVEVVGSHPLK